MLFKSIFLSIKERFGSKVDNENNKGLNDKASVESKAKLMHY